MGTEGHERVGVGRGELVGMASRTLSFKEYELQAINGKDADSHCYRNWGTNTEKKRTNWFMFDYLNPN